MEQEENKSAPSDDAWFDALRGKGDAGQAGRLGRILREVEQANAAQEDTSHDWQRLQFALRREATRQSSKSLSGLRYFALAASLLIIVGTATMLMNTSDVPYQSRTEEGGTVMRGVSEQVIVSATPAQDAKQLESELIRQGVKVVQRNMPDKTELHITLSYPIKNEVRAVLEGRTIPVPDQGDLTVIFISTAQ